jgi:hypothetical protein
MRAEGKEGRLFRYRHIETALAVIFGIKPESLGAFRGRLRHLRNIGVPNVPKPGSGEQIVYTREHAIELLLALELGALGITPRAAAMLAPTLVDDVSRSAADGVMSLGDCLIVHATTATGAALAFAADGMSAALVWWRPEFLESISRLGGRRFAVIKIADSVTQLDSALQAARAA